MRVTSWDSAVTSDWIEARSEVVFVPLAAWTDSVRMRYMIRIFFKIRDVTGSMAALQKAISCLTLSSKTASSKFRGVQKPPVALLF
jgi:hypothetical protein